MRCDALSVRARLMHAGRKRGERFVELLPRHGQGAPPVTQLVRRFAGEVERVGDAGQALRGVGARMVHSRQALASVIRWPARFPLSTVET